MYLNFITYSVLFILGSCVGSFLNVISDRLENGKSIIFGRSHCENCKNKLYVCDLIPIFSFLVLKGRCRYCKEKLSYVYLVSELLTGFIFVFTAFQLNLIKDISGFSILSYIYLIIVFCAYIVILLSDFKFRLIPDKVVIPIIILIFGTLIFNGFFTYFSTYNRLKVDPLGIYLIKVGYMKNVMSPIITGTLYVIASSFIISLFFWFLIVITKGRGMGFGDVKLGFLIGLFNAWPNNVLAIFLGFFSGALFSLILILFGKKGMKDTIAFGPFLILGSFVSFFWGSQIVKWYLGLF